MSKIFFWLAILTGFFVLVYLLKGVLLPFAAGLVIAYFLDPLADWFESRGFSRGISTGAVTLISLMLFIIAILILFPIMSSQFSYFLENIPKYIEAINLKIQPFIESINSKFPYQLDNIKADITKHIGVLLSSSGEFIKILLSKGFALINILSLLFITPIVAVYLLKDWDRITFKIKELVPEKHKETVGELFNKIDSILSGFLRGQISVCILLGLFYGLGLTLIGLKIGLVIGLLTGIISFIPFLGGILGFILSLILVFAEFGDLLHLLLVCLIFGLGQILEGYILTPRLVGKSVGLHPVWIIFALMAFGALFGFLGVLIAVPAAAVIGVLVRFGLDLYLSSKFYKNW